MSPVDFKKCLLSLFFKFSCVTRFPRRLENLENEDGHGKVMEHEKLAKVMEFCDQSWNFTNFPP